MRKLYKNLYLPIMLFLILFLLSGCAKNIPHPTITTSDNIKNVILIVGDGMGFNHINNAKTYFEIDDLIFENDYISSVNTSSKSIIATDSAAAATAMATGVNVYNKKIGMDGSKTLTNIMELAQQNDMLTGIITTDNLFGATPAGFSSHTSNRKNTSDIVSQQANSNIDLMVGEYSNEYYNSKQKFENNNYVMCDNTESLFNTNNNQNVIANLNNLKSIYNTNYSNQINLNDIVKFALEFLDNENGFVLLIECAHIDKFSHDKKIYDALCEVNTLFDVSETCYNFAKNRNDTAVLITADHETGGLKQANSKQDIKNNLYTKSSHSSKNVPFYAYNCSFKNVKDEVKNTFIFEVCKDIVNN